VILDNNRKLINSPLVLNDAEYFKNASGRCETGAETGGGDPGRYENVAGRYEPNFDDFERQIVENDVNLFLLCSPHNPDGRVWTPDELERMGDICARHDCIVVSDEIHCDFIFPGAKHTVFPSVKSAFADNCVLCTSPSKSFNLAGLQISNIIIENKTLRRAFKAEIAKAGYSQPSLPGVVACKAAYGEGGPWLDELNAYLLGNLNDLKKFLRDHIPQIKLIEPEGTYLIWLDLRSIVKTRSEARKLIVEEAGLWLDDGTMFGPEGEGFQRINIACPRAILTEALENLAAAVEKTTN
jgi:cystathionine beta-lyase